MTTIRIGSFKKTVSRIPGASLGLTYTVVAILVCSAFAAQAATLAMSSTDTCVVRLEGESVDGDYQRLEAIDATALKGSDGESSANKTTDRTVVDRLRLSVRRAGF